MLTHWRRKLANKVSDLAAQLAKLHNSTMSVLVESQHSAGQLVETVAPVQAVTKEAEALVAGSGEGGWGECWRGP